MAWRRTSRFNVTAEGISTFGNGINFGSSQSSQLGLTLIATTSTCTAISDNIHGAWTKITSTASGGTGAMELSLWKIGPVDFPSSLTITVTLAGNSLTSCCSLFFSPQGSDILLTGGVIQHTQVGNGSSSGTNLNADIQVQTDAPGAQVLWSFAALGFGGAQPGQYCSNLNGSSGDINGLANTDRLGNGGVTQTIDQIHFFQQQTVVTGLRDGDYTYGAGPSPNPYEVAAIGVAFTPPDVPILPTPPTAINQSYQTYYNTVLIVYPTGLLNGCTGTGITVTSHTNPNFGGLSGFGTDGSFTYTPNLNFAGADSFTYTITDMSLQTATATANIKVLDATIVPPSELDQGNLLDVFRVQKRERQSRLV